MKSLFLATLVVVGTGCATQPANLTPAPAPPPIQDNSFLVEEAYNQEPGVVQHISTFEEDQKSDLWAYGFTQEWPFRSQRHQLSYTLLYGRIAGEDAGLGDLALNYRLEFPSADRSVVVTPRLSLLLPTGSSARGRGAGATGLELALPVSVVLAPSLVAHFNALTSLTPSARNPVGDRATIRGLGFGQSFIWLARHNLNLMVETVWSRDEFVLGPDETAHETSFFISPGVRWAWTFPSGLQVVPGVAFPTGVGVSSGERSFFLYLSFEHSFVSSKELPARR